MIKKLYFVIPLLVVPFACALTPEDIALILQDECNQHLEETRMIDLNDEESPQRVDQTLRIKANSFVRTRLTQNKTPYEQLPAALQKDIDHACNTVCKQLQKRAADSKKTDNLLHRALERVLWKIVEPGVRYFNQDQIDRHLDNSFASIIADLHIPPACLTPSLKREIETSKQRMSKSLHDMMTQTRKGYVTSKEVKTVTNRYLRILFKQIWMIVQGYVYKAVIASTRTDHADDTLLETPSNVASTQALADFYKRFLDQLNQVPNPTPQIR
ncbi:hypothetical protein EBZ39_11495 [bacterium]|nr:hypothetical protein [bacterium]